MNRRGFLKVVAGLLMAPAVAVPAGRRRPWPLGRVPPRRLYISREAMEDIRAWEVTQIDEATKRQIFASCGEPIGHLHSVSLRASRAA